MIAFHGFELREYAIYVVKEVRHSRGLGQLMSMARNRTRTLALAAAGAKERKLLRRNWN